MDPSRSNIYFTDLAEKMEKIGVKYIIFTDNTREDGTLEGPNFGQLDELRKAVNVNIIASGGMHNLDDIYRLKEMDLYGAICGKSIYSGRIILSATRLPRAKKYNIREKKMLSKRIIPCLDVKEDGRVVKGTNFIGLRDAGDPVESAKFYNTQGADELVFLDITASSDKRKTITDVGRK